MSTYQPEVGQLVFGNPTQAYTVPEHGKALLLYLLNEISRVYWNRNQKTWEWSQMPDPKIPGLQVHAYQSDGEDEAPNLSFGDVAISWYKHPGRGLSCNRDLDAAGWVTWFTGCLAAVQKTDPVPGMSRN